MRLVKHTPAQGKRAAGPRPSSPTRGLYYDLRFVQPRERKLIEAYLGTIHPLWEERYSKNHPPPAGESQRGLLRPVYWLGNWQFACLNYYHPPLGVRHRCIRAEPLPEVLRELVRRAEAIVRRTFSGPEIPKGWQLNTCLVNLYGTRVEGDLYVDTARVGEHKDFEPGPVASISLGERALFQFVRSQGKGRPSRVVSQQWLDDGSLQIFGGSRWKEELFHRVQRVDRRAGFNFPLKVENFKTRRINFTFRYVPDAHVSAFSQLPRATAQDVLPYMKRLAENSPFFAREIRRGPSP